MKWFKYRNYWMVGCAMVFLPAMAQGQIPTGAVTMKAGVRETVVLSLPRNFSPANVVVDSNSEGSSLVLTLSGSGTDVVAVQVPILVRSNTGYRISALVQSEAATLANLTVLEARATGRFVSPNAVANLSVERKLDSRARNGQGQTAASDFSSLDLAAPLSVLSGPRVSLAGTLTSADNALAVTILIAAKPEAGTTRWSLRLILSGSPRDPF